MKLKIFFETNNVISRNMSLYLYVNLTAVLSGWFILLWR